VSPSDGSLVKEKVLVSVHSVTSPPHTETAWQELALEIAGIGVWEWDFESGQGQWSNGLCTLLGLCPGDTALGPDGLLQFVHPDEQTRYRNSIHSCLEGVSDHNLEYRVVLADQSVRWFLDRAKVLRGDNDEPTKMVGAITDVTERKQEEIARRELEKFAQGRRGAEQALIETEHRFKEILDYAPVAVYIKNLDGLLTFVNQRFLDLFKMSRDDVILQDRSHVHSPEILSQLREHDRLVIEAGRALQFEEMIEIGGVRQTYLSVKFPLHDHDGQAYALCGISADITARKQAEHEVNERSIALQKAIDEINQLTYSVSHEMGSPLRGVIGNIRFLREELGEKLEPGVDKRLHRVEFAALKMAQLVDDLLAYTRLGRQELVCEEIDFTDLAEQTLSKMMRDKAAYRESIVEVEDGIKFTADSEMLTTALIALLENSYKYRKPDAIARIRIRRIENGFSISDEGIGVDMQYANKIFLPFERLHRDADFAGTGIGLAKVQRIVERHGGKVWAESELGKGATFFLRFSPE
jgi:PAS domain S-box-containing protein